MKNFNTFVAHLRNGNTKGVTNCLKEEFVNKIVDNSQFPIGIACEKGFVDIVKLLMQNNCNIECRDSWKKRPIHYASENGHVEIVKLLMQNNCNIECENEGQLRPIHYASENGHVEIVKLLMQNNCNIECENEGKKRPIHYASMNGHVEIVKLLLQNNCNIECEDKWNKRPIHYAIQNGHVEIVKLLLQNNCNIECEDFKQLRPIHYASENGHIEIVKLLLQNNCNIECENEGKKRPIHYASMNGLVKIVKLLIQYNCNIECEDKWKKRPIHCASENGHVEIVKLLLQQKCQIDCQTKNGQIPLDLARTTNKMDCVELLAYVENLFSAIKQNDPIKFDELYKSDNFIMRNISFELSVLGIALKNNSDQIIKSILNKSIDNKEINDLKKELNSKTDKNKNLIKEYILYCCIIHQHVGGFKKFNTADIINGHCTIVGTSFLEIAAEQGCDVFIDEIMKKTIYNKSIWINAINKAKEKGFLEIQEEISERIILLESRLKVNLTILHTAICDNDTDMVKYILDHPNAVDINSNNETFGTALALAYSLHHRKCIRVLQQYQLDTNTQNKYLQTPLHEAIVNGVEENCEYLFDRVSDIDQIGFMGLTALHCAVIRGMINVCEKLVNKGADCMRYVQLSQQLFTNGIIIPFAKSKILLSHKENPLTLSMKFHGTLFTCFSDRLDLNSSNVHDGNDNSLLHLAVKSLDADLIRSLLKAGAKVNCINNLGNSPLLDMFYKAQIIVNDDILNKMIDIINILIEFGADVNVKSAKEITLFQTASIIGNEKLMLALVSNNPSLSNFCSNDFQAAFTNQWFKYAETLVRLLPDNFLSKNITNETFQKCEKAEPKLIKLLFNKSSSILQQSILENLLYDAVNSDNNELFENFIKIEILEPKLFKNGETLLTFMLKEKKIEFIWQLLESENRMKFVNLKNSRNENPLHIAIEIEEIDIMDNLIHEIEDFNSEDIDGKSVLTQLLRKISNCNNINFKRRLITFIKSLIQSGGDIYKVRSCGQRTIDACSENNVKTQIEKFYSENLKKHNQKNKEVVNQIVMCQICLDNFVNISFQCGHLSCIICSEELFICPFCNSDITNRTKLYFN